MIFGYLSTTERGAENTSLYMSNVFIQLLYPIPHTLGLLTAPERLYAMVLLGDQQLVSKFTAKLPLGDRMCYAALAG